MNEGNGKVASERVRDEFLIGWVWPLAALGH